MATGYQMTPESYSKLLATERNLTDLITEVDKAESCGIECQGYRNSIEAQLNQISLLKQTYAPKGPK